VGRRRWVPLLVTALAFALASAGVAAAAGKQRPGARVARQPLAQSLANAQWQTWWGTAIFGPNAVTLSSAVPTSPAETHSALVTSKRTWTDSTISFTTTTLAQLRTGSLPNPWEVGWVMFRFRDLSDYYWFILKTNGFELGKKQGSDTQIFLATGDLPSLAVGVPAQIQVQVQGARIRVSVGGAQVLDFTDPHPLLGAGSVGLYEEDSQVQFSSVAIS
jgi:hypothetical protein